MKATRNLEDDHFHILRLIDVMEILSRESEFRQEQLKEIVELIVKFADQMHHAKEENLLFPFMVEKGFSTQVGPVAVMLGDHAQGRKFVRQISEAIIPYRDGDKNALIQIREGMNGYIKLLRSHIDKENVILFRLADNLKDLEENDRLLSLFQTVDQGSGDQSSINYVARIDALVKTLPVL